MCSLVVGEPPQKMQYLDARAMAKSDEQYSEDESKLRFQAALKGARLAGHKPMESLTRAKTKKQQKIPKKARKPA
jgi:hypothetical protein